VTGEGGSQLLKKVTVPYILQVGRWEDVLADRKKNATSLRYSEVGNTLKLFCITALTIQCLYGITESRYS
jgi:hypothetical protein